jgi:hypothetical protein
MNDELRKEIEQLRREKTTALKARYRELFGEESSSSNHAHLFRRVAWRLQDFALCTCCKIHFKFDQGTELRMRRKIK